MTASSEASLASRARCCHAFPVVVASLSEQLLSLDRPCDLALAFFHAASSDCFHLQACCVPNRVEIEQKHQSDSLIAVVLWTYSNKMHFNTNKILCVFCFCPDDAIFWFYFYWWTFLLLQAIKHSQNAFKRWSRLGSKWFTCWGRFLCFWWGFISRELSEDSKIMNLLCGEHKFELYEWVIY